MCRSLCYYIGELLTLTVTFSYRTIFNFRVANFKLSSRQNVHTISLDVLESHGFELSSLLRRKAGKERREEVKEEKRHVMGLETTTSVLAGQPCACDSSPRLQM